MKIIVRTTMNKVIVEIMTKLFSSIDQWFYLILSCLFQSKPSMRMLLLIRFSINKIKSKFPLKR